MADEVEKPKLSLNISDIIPPLGSDKQPMSAADLRSAFATAGFDMAPDGEDGADLSPVGLGDVKSGLLAVPHTIIEWTSDRVTFEPGRYVAPPNVDADGRCI